jgi:hypothetical protein
VAEFSAPTVPPVVQFSVEIVLVAEFSALTTLPVVEFSVEIVLAIEFNALLDLRVVECSVELTPVVEFSANATRGMAQSRQVLPQIWGQILSSKHEIRRFHAASDH